MSRGQLSRDQRELGLEGIFYELSSNPCPKEKDKC